MKAKIAMGDFALVLEDGKVTITVSAEEGAYVESTNKDNTGHSFAHDEAHTIVIKRNRPRPDARVVKPGDGSAVKPSNGPEGEWLTWPPERELTVGREYLIRTRHPGQRYPRESRMSYLGMVFDNSHSFNACPAAGTQSMDSRYIIATKDIGPSGGRSDERRYVAKVLRPNGAGD